VPKKLTPLNGLPAVPPPVNPEGLTITVLKYARERSAVGPTGAGETDAQFI